MKSRVISTLSLWGIVITLPLVLGEIGAFLIIITFAVWTAFDVTHLLRKAHFSADRIVSISILFATLVTLALLPPWIVPPLTIYAVAFPLLVTITLMTAPLGGFIQSITANTLTYLLVGLPFGLMIVMIQETNLFLTIWVVVVTKFTDMGALLLGSWLGKHKMAPTLSPHKTWEGLAGGVFMAVTASCLFVFLFDHWLPLRLTLLHAAWMAVPIALAAVFSDLAESAFKRDANVKDSGNLIPGIGGCFDLTDSFILAFPTAYFLIWLII